jgi:hypothetical protein
MSATKTGNGQRCVWQVFRKFTDVNTPGHIHRQNLGCYGSKQECEQAILLYEGRYPDSFVDGEVHYY